jgi:phenylacetic acid degradation operon negative regulatory protein
MRLKDKILLGLAVGSQIIDDVVGSGARAYHARKLWFWTPPDYQKNNYSSLVRRLLKEDSIERVVDSGRVYYRLKGEGKKELLKQFPALRLASKPWDGFWRLIIFDIPETRRVLRDRLRRKLNELGFGMIQHSVYISPHDLGEDLKNFFQKHGLWGDVLILEAKQKYLGNPRDVAAKIWHLDKINLKYQKIIDQLNSQFGIKKKSQREVFFKKIHEKYLQILNQDPFLPKELLPKNWQGERVRQMINRATDVL